MSRRSAPPSPETEAEALLRDIDAALSRPVGGRSDAMRRLLGRRSAVVFIGTDDPRGSQPGRACRAVRARLAAVPPLSAAYRRARSALAGARHIRIWHLVPRPAFAGGLLRIAVASRDVPFVQDGRERYAAALCAALVDAGHAVEPVPLPFGAPDPVTDEAMEALRFVALGPQVDLLVCIGSPAVALRHRVKVAWITDEDVTPAMVADARRVYAASPQLAAWLEGNGIRCDGVVTPVGGDWTTAIRMLLR